MLNVFSVILFLGCKSHGEVFIFFPVYYLEFFEFWKILCVTYSIIKTVTWRKKIYHVSNSSCTHQRRMVLLNNILMCTLNNVEHSEEMMLKHIVINYKHCLAFLLKKLAWSSQVFYNSTTTEVLNNAIVKI